MATEFRTLLPTKLDDPRQHTARQLQRLFVLTLAGALAMIALLIGIGLSVENLPEANSDRPTAATQSR